MNYLKIYNNFIEDVKITEPFERLIRRNPEDYRKNYDYIYTEKHHITPKSLGGDDSDNNIIILLPEEHLFIHYFRYKIFNTREDLLAYRFCLNGYNSKAYRQMKYTKKLKVGYSKLRQESSNFRKTHGWQTEDGKKRISDARKGKICVKDLDGNKIGYVPCDCQEVLDGIYVHHSLGLKRNDKTKKYISKITTGEKNGNYSGLTDDDIINSILKLSKEFKKLLPYHTYIKICQERNIKHIKAFSKNRFNGSRKELYEELQLRCDLPYNPLERTVEQREKIRNSLLRRKNINVEN